MDTAVQETSTLINTHILIFLFLDKHLIVSAFWIISSIAWSFGYYEMMIIFFERWIKCQKLLKKIFIVPAGRFKIGYSLLCYFESRTVRLIINNTFIR